MKTCIYACLDILHADQRRYKFKSIPTFSLSVLLVFFLHYYNTTYTYPLAQRVRRKFYMHTLPLSTDAIRIPFAPRFNCMETYILNPV